MNRNFRSLDINTQQNKESSDFVYTLSFASTEPYPRFFGDEIIDVKKMDLTKLNNRAALLFNHDADKLIGVVEKAWIDEITETAHAVVRLDETNEEAIKIKRSIDNGVISKVSFGYEVLKYNYITTKSDGVEVYKAETRPFEISIVSVPADDTVFINKKDFDGLVAYNDNIRETKTLLNEEKKNMENIDNIEAKEIAELGNLIGEKELAIQFITEQRSLKDFKNAIKSKKQESKPLPQVESNIPTVSEKSFGQLVKDLAAEKRSASFRNFTGVTQAQHGKELVRHEYSDIISNTIDSSVLGKMGYNILRNIVGETYTFRGVEDVEGGGGYSEGDTVTKGYLKTANYKATKTRYSLPLKYSYELLKQTAENIESVILNEGLKHVYNQISSGILQSVAQSDNLKKVGNVATYSDILKLEGAVTLQTGDHPKFLTTNKALTHFKGVPKFAAGGVGFVDNNNIDGFETVVTPYIDSEGGIWGSNGEPILFGDFSKVGVILDDPEIFINTYPDDKDMFEVKFICSFASVLTSPHSVSVATLTE